MQANITKFKLGASIYVPCTRNIDNLLEVANHNKLNAKSIIFCTEDSVSDADLPLALKNLELLISALDSSSTTLRFVRVRNISVLKKVLRMKGVSRLDGFVFPKITANNFMDYWNSMESVIKDRGLENKFYIMPTLETREAFSTEEMTKLLRIFKIDYIAKHILSLRIGGNDLLNLLNIRRSKYRTIYETPIGPVISNLVTIFKPYGFNLSAPVCELLYDSEILAREVPLDLEHGLFGKTAIHPDQISVIENNFKVSKEDLDMAQAILDPDAPAVFRMHGTMCEVATHKNWAEEIKIRADIYGILGF